MTVRISIGLGVLALLVSMLSCRQDDFTGFETIDEDCNNKCYIVTHVCDAAVPDEEASQRACVEECLAWADESEDQSPACAEAFEMMMICVGILESCEQVTSWGRRESGSECMEEANEFDLRCDGF